LGSQTEAYHLSSNTEALRGIGLALIANFIWGFAALYWMQTKPVEPIDVMAHRGLWTLPVTLFIILCFRRLRETLALISSVRFLGWVALAAFMLTINWGVYVFAVTNERATEASLGYFMLPLLTILVGRLAFREVMGSAQWVAVLLAVIAVAMQLWAYGSLPWISLVVASSFALYGAIRKKIVADTMQGLFIETLCMAPFALGWLWLTGGAGLGQHGLKVDSFLVLAGVYTTAPLLTYIAASRLLPLNVVGLTAYLGPSLQLLVAQTALGESIDTATATSFALVWMGVLLVSGQGLARFRKRL